MKSRSKTNLIDTIAAAIRYVLYGRDEDQAFLMGDNSMTTVQIIPTDNGRFAVTDRHGTTVSTYARARDAKRGAQRLGYVVA